MIQNNILINTETRKIKSRDYDFLGVAGENNIEQIVFKLSAFINGEAILEIEKYNKEDKLETHYFELQKQDESYVYEVKSSLLDVAKDVKMQLHITTANEEVFKSNIFTMKVREAINATKTIPEEYESWIDSANAKIAQMQLLEETVSKSEDERNKAETERNTSEKAREKAETERETAENNRDLAETARKTAEAIRKKNESDRIINENGRVEAENNRSSAEEARATAEDERKTYINNLKKDIENGELNGATFTPHLDLDGNLSWTNNKNLDNPTEINIMGPQGPQGPQGETGIQGPPGSTYQVTEEDLQAIADNITADANSKFNQNVEEQITEFDNNVETKQDEFDAHAEEKVAEFNENAQSYATELEELAQQMPWKTTNIEESIHIEDSAKYSKNKLDIFGNLNQETREGYNLFKLPESATNNGIDYNKNEDGTFYIVGTATKQATFSIVVPAEKSGFVANESYTISSNNVIGDVRYYIHNCSSAGVWNKTQLDFINETTKTKTFAESTTNYISCNIVVPAGVTVNLTNVKVQVVKGTGEKDWEQYGAMPSLEYPSMPVVATGVQKIRKIYKNIFDGEVEIGGLNLDGSLNSTSDRWRSVNYVNVKKIDNVTITLSNKTFSSAVGRYLLYNANKELIHNSQITSNNFVIDTSNASYLKFWILINIADITTQVQIEKGTDATEYEPYQEEKFTLDLADTELCKIVDSDGNVVAQDRAVYRLQEDRTYKWQWKKNIVKIILNGTETWEIDQLRPNCNYRSFYTTTTKLKPESFIISNSLENNNDIYYIDSLGICVNWQSSIRIKNGVSKTVEELQTWLYANNLTCYCIVKTPEYEDCTAEQSEVLDKLHKLALEKGTNNIFVESENGVTTELQLEYMQDNNLLKKQEHKALEDRITALEELLSTTQTSAMLLDNMQSDLESEV